MSKDDRLSLQIHDFQSATNSAKLGILLLKNKKLTFDETQIVIAEMDINCLQVYENWLEIKKYIKNNFPLES